jgi:hypothetical protein
MANIRRKNKQFQVRLTIKGKSISATFPTREAATARAVATRQALLLGKHADVERARRHTFGQLLGRYSEKITPPSAASARTCSASACCAASPSRSASPASWPRWNSRTCATIHLS